MFDKEDIGKRVHLTLDLVNITEDNFKSFDDTFKVFYGVITKYYFLVMIRESSKPVLEIVGSRERLDFLKIGKVLGATTTTLTGYIQEVNEDYVVIKK